MLIYRLRVDKVSLILTSGVISDGWPNWERGNLDLPLRMGHTITLQKQQLYLTVEFDLLLRIAVLSRGNKHLSQ